MTQPQRDRAMDAFRQGEANVLVATNVAARGIDVRHVGMVINYELPESAELLTHRIGRTGRMGADGVAVTLIAPEDELKWRRLRRDGAPDLPREQNWTESERSSAERSSGGTARGGRGRRPAFAGPRPSAGGRGRRPAARAL
jgi:superfamily II DNA/RNA helicase